MALVTLPEDHREADLALATRLVAEFELEELHVFERTDLRLAPVPPPEAAAQPAPQRHWLSRAFGAVDRFLERLADAVAPWSRQPNTGNDRRDASRSTPAWSAETTSRSFRST